MPRELTGLVLKDKWRIDAFLGEGGVAAVYAATHRNGKRVAVKVLHPHLASIPEVRDRFLREGYLANRVDHPGAVGVLDDDITDDGIVFFVMDPLDSESLEKRLAREGRLAPADVLAITANLLDVIAAAHAKRIVHRDIKPENIYLLRDGGRRLLDFGIARLHEQAAAKNATQSGAAMGTPSYMPPEQARGRWEMVDARSDLWSVGATMFALLTGRCVHEAETVNETLLLAMARPAARLETLWPQAPTFLAAIVDRALAFEMNDRWPDALSMRAAVQQARLTLAAQPEAPVQTWSAPVTMARQPTPSGPRGTVLASSVSDRPPAPGGALATRRRAAIGLSVGAGLGAIALVVVLVAWGHKSGAQPGTSGSSTPPPNGVPAATALPSAVLAAEPEPIPAAPSASVEAEISQPPAASATAAVNAQPPPTPYRPRPRRSPSHPGAPRLLLRPPIRPLTPRRIHSIGGIMKFMRLVLVPAVPCIALLTTAARAQHDPAAAESLFRDAKAAEGRGDYKIACAQFAESQRLDPAAGTLLNEADCEERTGAVATAWSHFVEARDELAKNDDRVPYAQQRVAALEKRVPHLIVRLPAGAPAGTKVMRGPVEIGAASLGVPFAVDSGPVTITATLPGAPVSKDVTIAEGETKDVTVDLVPAAAQHPAATAVPAPPPPTEMTPSSSGDTRRTLGWVLGGVGVATLAAGVVTGIMATSDASTVKNDCNGAAPAEIRRASTPRRTARRCPPSARSGSSAARRSRGWGSTCF